MIKWLLELVFTLSIKRNCSVSFRCARHFVRRSYTTQLEIGNVLMWIEDHTRKGLAI